MFLLRETDRSVTDICLDVGFGSLGTFSRTFRDIVGESPSAYRAARASAVAQPCRRASRWPGRDRAVSEKRASPGGSSVRRMLNAITLFQIFVLDQDQALDFYVGKLGLEVKQRHRPRLHALADRRRARASPTARSCSSSRARRP